MADQIGPLAIRVTVASDGVSSGLQAAAQAMNQGLAKIAGDVTRVSAGLGDIFTGDLTRGIRQLGMGSAALATDLSKTMEKAMGNPGRFLAEDVIGGLAIGIGKIPAVGGLLSLPFEAAASAGKLAMDAYDRGSERVLELGKAAQQAGIGMGDFQTITTAMGGDSASASLMIDKLQRSLDEARVGALGADSVFKRLKLSPFDLRADVEGIGKINDAIKSLPSSAQAGIIRDLYGRSADKSLVQKGSAGLAKAGGLLDAYGADFGEDTFALVKRAKEAQKEIGLFKQGFETQVTVGLAPVFAGFASLMPKLSEMGLSAKGLSGVVENIGFGILELGIGVVEFLKKAFEDPWGTLEETWGRVKAWFLGDAAAWAASLGEQIGEGISRGLGGELGEALNEFITRKRQKESGRFNRETALTLEEAEFNAANPGWNERAAKLGAMKPLLEGPSMPVWDDEAGFRALRQTSSLRDALAEFRESLKGVKADAEVFNPFMPWVDALQRLNQQMASPLEKLKMEFGDLRARLAVPEGAFTGVDDAEAGFRQLQLEEQLRGKGGFDMLSKLRSATGGAPLGSQFVGAAEAGSREAYSAATAYNAEVEDPAAETARRMKELADLAKVQNDIGAKVYDVLQAMRNDEGWGFP